MIATGVLDYALAPETEDVCANDMIDPADLGVESAKS